MSNPKITVECAGSFRVNVLPGGRVELELEDVSNLPANETLYDKQGVAKRLGATLRSIDNWMNQKKHPLPYLRLGGRPRFRESDVVWWLAEGCSVASRRASHALEAARGTAFPYTAASKEQTPSPRRRVIIREDDEAEHGQKWAGLE